MPRLHHNHKPILSSSITIKSSIFVFCSFFFFMRRFPARCLAYQAPPSPSSSASSHIHAHTTTNAASNKEAERLAGFLQDAKRVVAITGAGISTESGIPDYRSPAGSYSRGFKPMVHDEFINKEVKRKRYWARSMLGYSKFSGARPNAGHKALVTLEKDLGKLDHLITQNVDGLHQRAGSEQVMDLHGRNDRCVCLNCQRLTPRRGFQAELEEINQDWTRKYVPETELQMFSDGDVDLENVAYEEFHVPACSSCGGVLKPAVTFFGDVVPQEKVNEAFARVAEADAILVAGTSLMVYSSWRFVLAAAKAGTKIAIVNQGPTRAEKEGIAHVKMEGGGCGEVLGGAMELLLEEGKK